MDQRRGATEQTVRKGLDCIHCFRRDVVSQGELAKSGHSAAFHLCADADDSDQGEDACKPGVQPREMKGLGLDRRDGSTTRSDGAISPTLSVVSQG